MRFKNFLTLASLALLLGATDASVRARQQEDQKVIEDFVTTRGVTFEEPAKKAQPSKKSAGGASRSKPGGASQKSGVASKKSTPAGKSSSGTTASNNAPAGKTVAGDAAALADGGGSALNDSGAQTVDASLGAQPRPIGLGYTIFMKDPAGALYPVDASQEFKTGDRIAIALETNTDGYLYVFNAENGKNPMMLFPNVQLDGGANAARAHVRETYPSDMNVAFEFVDDPATEHLFIIVSREPLADVPTGDALAKFCGKNTEDCYWQPSPAQWERIKMGAPGKGVLEAKNRTLLAQAKPAGNLTRGIKIKKDDPKPAVVRVNDSPDAAVLVTKIELVHK